jgi:hypothetical protein
MPEALDKSLAYAFEVVLGLTIVHIAPSIEKYYRKRYAEQFAANPGRRMLADLLLMLLTRTAPIVQVSWLAIGGWFLIALGLMQLIDLLIRQHTSS